MRADEADTLLGFLEFHRATFRAKVDGVSRAGLNETVAASTMTLAGMIKHLALVEKSWFVEVWKGEPMGQPWDDVDWDADRDWDWHSAAEDSTEQLFALYEECVSAARNAVAAELASGSLDDLSERAARDGSGHFSLRWIMVHMIEEYARHNGHADLLREAYDGSVGE